MPSQAIRFRGALGNELAARLEVPLAQPRAYAVFAHCFTCSKESKAATYVSQTLAARGIAVLRFDFTGLGGSGGDFANSNFSSNVGDVVAAASYLREEHGAPQLLVGHSLGGAAVLAAAHHITEARAVATIGAPYEARHVERHLVEGRDRILAIGEALVDIGGRPFVIRRQFLEDLEQHNAAGVMAGLGKALLLLHSPRDRIVEIDNASRIFLAAKHPKSFISLDDADHLVSRSEDAAYVAEVLGAWASRYLSEKAAEAGDPA
jgi:putative redox protein